MKHYSTTTLALGTLPKSITVKGAKYYLKQFQEPNKDRQDSIHCVLYAKKSDRFFEDFHIESHGTDISRVLSKLKRKLKPYTPNKKIRVRSLI